MFGQIKKRRNALGKTYLEVPIGFEPTMAELQSGLGDIGFEAITNEHSVKND